MRHAQPQRAAARAGHLKLQCPECTHTVRVSRDERVEGAAVHCRHCGGDSELTLGYDLGTGKEQWQLVDPLIDFSDDADAPR